MASAKQASTYTQVGPRNIGNYCEPHKTVDSDKLDYRPRMIFMIARLWGWRMMIFQISGFPTLKEGWQTERAALDSNR